MVSSLHWSEMSLCRKKDLTAPPPHPSYLLIACIVLSQQKSRMIGVLFFFLPLPPYTFANPIITFLSTTQTYDLYLYNWEYWKRSSLSPSNRILEMWRFESLLLQIWVVGYRINAELWNVKVEGWPSWELDKIKKKMPQWAKIKRFNDGHSVPKSLQFNFDAFGTLANSSSKIEFGFLPYFSTNFVTKSVYRGH